ncbi:MAG: hypothetical protein IJU70_00665, partial [Lentisphaeria bacterium]|nr:hypothetical protein [Lentisphaeria bacterium]
MQDGTARSCDTFFVMRRKEGGTNGFQRRPSANRLFRTPARRAKTTREFLRDRHTTSHRKYHKKTFFQAQNNKNSFWGKEKTERRKSIPRFVIDFFRKHAILDRDLQQQHTGTGTVIKVSKS